MEQNTTNQLNITLPEDIQEGIYSNLAIITHSDNEFVVDFISVMPNTPQARVASRIVLTPQAAKRFMRAMSENVARYEAQFGTIKEHNNVPPNNFSGGAGPSAR